MLIPLQYGTVLDQLPTRSFVVKKDGTTIDFSGVKVAIELNDNAYTTIKSGESVTVEHSRKQKISCPLALADGRDSRYPLRLRLRRRRLVHL